MFAGLCEDMAAFCWGCAMRQNFCRVVFGSNWLRITASKVTVAVVVVAFAAVGFVVLVVAIIVVLLVAVVRKHQPEEIEKMRIEMEEIWVAELKTNTQVPLHNSTSSR